MISVDEIASEIERDFPGVNLFDEDFLDAYSVVREDLSRQRDEEEPEWTTHYAVRAKLAKPADFYFAIVDGVVLISSKYGTDNQSECNDHRAAVGNIPDCLVPQKSVIVPDFIQNGVYKSNDLRDMEDIRQDLLALGFEENTNLIDQARSTRGPKEFLKKNAKGRKELSPFTQYLIRQNPGIDPVDDEFEQTVEDALEEYDPGLDVDDVLEEVYDDLLRPANFYFAKKGEEIIITPRSLWDEEQVYDDRNLAVYVAPTFLSNLGSSRFEIADDSSFRNVKSKLKRMGFVENRGIV